MMGMVRDNDELIITEYWMRRISPGGGSRMNNDREDGQISSSITRVIR